MRLRSALLIVASGIFAVAAPGQTPAHVGSAVTGAQSSTDSGSGASETPAQQRIRIAKNQLASGTVRPNTLNDLAIAYLRRERETRDTSYLKDAQQALDKAIALAPVEFQLQKTQVEILLAKHLYAEAKEKATQLNKQTPDDVMTYGYLAEADIALGNLDAADTAAQWMLNMRPNNIPGLLLGARLRALYGDREGALDLLKLAYSESSPTETDELAHIANLMASIEIDEGKNAEAGALLQQAQQLFPDYPETVDNLNRIKLGQHASHSTETSHAQPSPTSDNAGISQTSLPPDLSVPSGRSSGPRKTSQVARFSAVPPNLLVPLPTDTDRMIRKAQSAVAANPADANAYAELGAAHSQRARETGDVSEYQLAEESLNKSLGIVSTDFAADTPLGSLAEVCMGEHRFSDALAYSQKALALGSGDVSPFAIVGDAYADMGEYDKAAGAYARLTPRDMILSPHAAYARDSRLAYLQFIRGDTGGAIALMQTAASEGSAAQLPAENLAWLYYELGEFLTQDGDTAAADAAYITALNTHPGDYRALAALAKLRANNGRYAEAVELYSHAIAVVPMPIFVAELGDLYSRMGNKSEAAKQYQLVEYIGLLGQINQVLHNRDLALFYADHDLKLPEALRLAQKELEVRHDIYTWDAFAWALYKNGNYAEAEEASRKALQFGTRDSLLLFHAGMIAGHGGYRDRAALLLKDALETNAHFSLRYSDIAAKQMEALNTQATSGENNAR